MESTISKKPQYRDEDIQQFPFQHFHAAYIETQSLSKTVFRPTVWKCYIDDIFSLWDINKPDMVDFFKFTEQVNLLHPTGYEIYARNIWLWDNLFRPRCIPSHNIQRKMRKSYHWRKDEFKRKPSSIYIFTSYHPPNVKMDLTNFFQLE